MKVKTSVKAGKLTASAARSSKGRIFPEILPTYFILKESIQMNVIRKLSTVLLLSSLALTALPAEARHTVFDAERRDNAGTTTRVCEPHATHFCYLSSVGMQDTDTGGERATCRVRQSGTVWILEAILRQNDDADVFCSASCVPY
jgi:hypothetical protein